MWAAKRSFDDDSSGSSQGASDASTSTDGDVLPVPEMRRLREAHNKPRPARKKTPCEFVELGPALQSLLRKLQHVATRGAGLLKSEAANKAIFLLQPDYKSENATGVAATFPSHATSKSQRVVDIFAMNAENGDDDKLDGETSREDRVGRGVALRR